MKKETIEFWMSIVCNSAHSPPNVFAKSIIIKNQIFIDKKYIINLNKSD